MPEGPETRREAHKIRALRGQLVKLIPVNKLAVQARYAPVRAQLAQIPKIVRVRHVLVHGKELFLELHVPRAYGMSAPAAASGVAAETKREKQPEQAEAPAAASPPERKSSQNEEERMVAELSASGDRTEENTLYLQAHMGMGGSFFSLDNSDPKQRHSKGVRPKHVLLEVVPQDASLGRGWGFADIRGFGRLTVMTPAEYGAHLTLKGPDVMSRQFTEAALTAAIGSSKGRVAGLLPNQRVLSGIGNYLRSETLWEARIDPKKRGCDLTPAELHRLYEAIRTVTAEVYAQGEAYKFRVYQQALDRDGQLTNHTEEAQKVWWTPTRQN